MRLIIAGSRTLNSLASIDYAMEQAGWLDEVEHVVSGGARGVDRAAEMWARKREIPFTVYPAQWSKHGRSAGPIRNKVMADDADALLAIWDGQSKGTKHMIDTAHDHGLRVYVYEATGYR